MLGSPSLKSSRVGYLFADANYTALEQREATLDQQGIATVAVMYNIVATFRFS